ncbi:MAG: DUF3300 domain-containing protein [Limisphaerales bacterium]
MTKNLPLACLLVMWGLGSLMDLRAQDAPAGAPPPSAAAKASAADLEKLVAPIALHPDPLVSIILPASVYPLEVVQAARFVRDTNNIPEVDEQDWDDNVKAVAKFPEVVTMMSEDLDWTMNLGQAFVDQPKELMDAIQMLRVKANSGGILKTTPQQVVVVTNTVVEKTIEQQVVVVTNTVVQIQPANPQVVYVPTYPPTIYYPPPAYVGPPPVLTFAAGVALGAVIANNCDWHGGGVYVGRGGVWVSGGGYRGDVDINVNRNVNINNNVSINNVNRTGNSGQKWQPDQARMNTATASKPGTKTAQSRGWDSATTQANVANRASSTTARPSTPAARPSAPASRPATTPAPQRPSPSPSPSPSVARPSTGGGTSAFGGVGGGASAHQASQRGSFSRGGASGGGGGGGGGGGRIQGGRRR